MNESIGHYKAIRDHFVWRTESNEENDEQDDFDDISDEPDSEE